MAPRYLLSISLMVLGAFWSLSSTVPLGIWMGLEINLLGMIPFLATHSREYTSFGSITYFCYQSIGSALLLLGLIFWVPLACVALVLKLGAAPLHSWVAPVMTGATWYTNLILLTIQKAAPLYLTMVAMTLSGSHPTESSVWGFSNGVLLVSAWLSGIVGGLGGYGLANLKGLVAYSSILNMGWLLLLSRSGAAFPLTFYFLFYTSITVLLISSLFDSNNDLPTPWTRTSVSVGLLSLAGLPPLLGFTPKLMVLLECPFYGTLPLILGSLLALFYYLQSTMSFSLSGPGFSARSHLDTKELLGMYKADSFAFVFNGLGGLIVITVLLASFYF